MFDVAMISFWCLGVMYVWTLSGFWISYIQTFLLMSATSYAFVRYSFFKCVFLWCNSIYMYNTEENYWMIHTPFPFLNVSNCFPKNISKIPFSNMFFCCQLIRQIWFHKEVVLHIYMCRYILVYSLWNKIDHGISA